MLFRSGSFERNGQVARLRLTLIDPKKTREIGFVDVESPTGDLGALQDEAVTRLSRQCAQVTGRIAGRSCNAVEQAYEYHRRG